MSQNPVETNRISKSLQEGSTLAFLVFGAAVFVLVHGFFAITQDSIRWGEKPGIFFTLSFSKIKFTAAVLFLTAASALSFVRRPRSQIARAGLAMLAGTLMAMVVVLFLIGPGNLWPIVIVFGGALLAPAFILATLLSLLVTELRDRWTSRRS